MLRYLGLCWSFLVLVLCLLWLPVLLLLIAESPHDAAE